MIREQLANETAVCALPAVEEIAPEADMVAEAMFPEEVSEETDAAPEHVPAVLVRPPAAAIPQPRTRPTTSATDGQGLNQLSLHALTCQEALT